MAAGGYPRRRDRDSRRQGNGTGVGDFAAPGQYLPALLLRSVGRTLATARGHRRYDRRAVRRRSGCRLRARGGRRRFLDAMRTQFETFALALHPEKTRLIEFGRHAAVNRERRGIGKPETFNFLGFTFICGKSRGGKFLVHRKTRRDRMQAKLKEVKEQLRRRRHQPIPEQGKWLRQVVTGHFVYY